MKRTASRSTSSTSAPRLVGYVRVSTTEQSERGVSLSAQRDRITAYASALGFDLVGIEEDAGFSGALTPARRPGLSRALDMVARGDADGLVVVKLDRLSRKVRDTLDLLDRADRKGWRLLSVSEALDTGSAAGRMVVAVLAALAQMEREQIGERVDAAHARIFKEGRARSRIVPFGYRLAGSDATTVTAGDRSPLVEDAREKAALARIVALDAEGHGTLRIATTLNDEGIHNPRTGAPWSRPSIRSILATVARRSKAAEESEGT